jgi:hypothetical protein
VSECRRQGGGEGKEGKAGLSEAGSVGEVMEPASFRSRAKDFEIRACNNKRTGHT